MTPFGNFVTITRVKDWVEIFLVRDVLPTLMSTFVASAPDFSLPADHAGKKRAKWTKKRRERQRQKAQAAQQAKSTVLSEFTCLQLLVLAA